MRSPRKSITTRTGAKRKAGLLSATFQFPDVLTATFTSPHQLLAEESPVPGKPRVFAHLRRLLQLSQVSALIGKVSTKSRRDKKVCGESRVRRIKINGFALFISHPPGLLCQHVSIMVCFRPVQLYLLEHGVFAASPFIIPVGAKSMTFIKFKVRSVGRGCLAKSC